MQKIKLLAMDIDGTLIPGVGEDIAQVDLEAIRCAQRAGVKVTLSTGRILGTAKSWVQRLNIEGPVITCNGADMRDMQKSYFKDNLSFEGMKEILSAYRDTGLKRYVFSDNHIYCTHEDYFEKLFDKWRMGNGGELPVTMYESDEQLCERVADDIQKVLVWGHEEEQAVMEERSKQFAGRFDVVPSGPDNVEFNGLGVSKGKALAALAEYYGFDISETMAIGDGGNDTDMLKAAGIGVAMGNAMEGPLKAADYVTADVRHGGVAQAIDKFVFGK